MADFNWPVAPDPEPPPPGKYTVSYLRARLVENRFNRNTIELHFTVVEPAKWAGKTVKKYYALPIDEPPGLDSNYYHDWCRANESPPKRHDRMSPIVFRGYWHAELGLTKQRAKRGGGVRELKDGEHGRVVIENLIERATGARRR